MTTTPHTDCPHPATKAARAKCRKARAQAPSSQALVDAYHAGADLEEIAAQAPAEIAKAYYDNSLDAEEFIAALSNGELPDKAEGELTITANGKTTTANAIALYLITKDACNDPALMRERQILRHRIIGELGIHTSEFLPLVRATLESHNINPY